MQITQTSADGLKREFKVVIAAKDIDEKMGVRLQELGHSVRVPGFRPGKVPKAVLKQRFGPSVVSEILEKSVADSANQAMTEKGVRPALQPKIEITSYEEGTDLEYTMAVELLPEFEPADPSKFELERMVVKIGDKEVEEALARVAEQHKKSQSIETPRKSQAGDVLVIDFKGTVDGAEFPGGAAEGHHLELGSNTFIAGFEDQLTGVGKDDHVTVKVAFPAEYGNKELAGKDAVFEVDVKDIREPVPVPADDELAKMVGMDDLDALKASIRGSIEQEYSTVTRARLKRRLLDTLADGHDFEVPAGMVDLEFDTIWAQVEEQRKQGELEDLDKDKSEDELKTDFREIAVRRVRLGLLLSEIGSRNNIEVAQEDVSRAIMAEAQRMPGYEQQVFEYYQKNDEALASLRAPLFEDKVIDFILGQANITEREVTVEDLLAESEAPAASAKGKKKSASKSKSVTKKSAGKSKK